MLPIVVVTPETIPQPSSEDPVAEAGAETRAPAPFAADSDQTIMLSSVITDITLDHSTTYLIPSGRTYRSGAMMTLNKTQPMNCFVFIFADAGKWFDMCWKLGKIEASTFWTQSPPVHD